MIRNRGYPVILATVLASLAALGPAFADEPASPYEKVLYRWIGGQETSLGWVPFSRIQLFDLDAEPAETLISEEQRVLLARFVESAKKRGTCGLPAHHDRTAHHVGWPLRPQSVTIDEIVVSFTTAVVGTVEATVAGWDLDLGRTTTLVYLRVNEVLRDETSSIEKGDLITFYRAWGRGEIADTNLCTPPPIGVSQLGIDTVGRSRLVVGTLDAWNSEHLETLEISVLAIEEKNVLPPRPASRYKEFVQQARSLTALREVIRKRGPKGKDCRRTGSR